MEYTLYKDESSKADYEHHYQLYSDTPESRVTHNSDFDGSDRDTFRDACLFPDEHAWATSPNTPVLDYLAADQFERLLQFTPFLEQDEDWAPHFPSIIDVGKMTTISHRDKCIIEMPQELTLDSLQNYKRSDQFDKFSNAYNLTSTITIVYGSLSKLNTFSSHLRIEVGEMPQFKYVKFDGPASHISRALVQAADCDNPVIWLPKERDYPHIPKVKRIMYAFHTGFFKVVKLQRGALFNKLARSVATKLKQCTFGEIAPLGLINYGALITVVNVSHCPSAYGSLCFAITSSFHLSAQKVFTTSYLNDASFLNSDKFFRALRAHFTECVLHKGGLRYWIVYFEDNTALKSLDSDTINVWLRVFTESYNKRGAELFVAYAYKSGTNCFGTKMVNPKYPDAKSSEYVFNSNAFMTPEQFQMLTYILMDMGPHRPLDAGTIYGDLGKLHGKHSVYIAGRNRFYGDAYKLNFS